MRGGKSMRVRVIGLSICLLALIALGAYAGDGLGASAKLQEATPEAAATPEVTVNVVTLVGWYQQDPSGGFLNIGPLRTNDNLVAGPGDVTDRTLTGKVNFDDPANDGLPRITLGQSAFEARPVLDDPDVVQRWIYYDEDPSLRPATLVLQIVATKGPYADYRGTATFVSRANDAGGVIVIVLNPPA
jgi:hypothetical protein